MKHASRFGLPEMAVPPVDFRAVAERIRSVIDRIQAHDSVERFRNLGVRVEFGEARFVNEHTIALHGRRLSARNWVIATGSSPAAPRIEGLDRVPFLTNRNLFSLDRLPASMIILGAGAIGLEMAQAFSRLGSKVTVLEAEDQVLVTEDKDMAKLLMDRLASEGVAFHLKAKARRVVDLGDERRVTVETHTGESIELGAEALLVAAGRTANLNGLGLEALGLQFDGRGLKLDEQLRTSPHKHIFGAGDATGAYQFTHAAGYEGGVVVSNALFHIPRKANYTLLPWCAFTSPELAGVGMNEKMAARAGLDYRILTEKFSDNDRSLAEGEEEGAIKVVLDGREKPVGVRIFGLHAGEVLSEWVAILNGKVRLATLAAAVHPYPTLSEINKKVAGELYSRKIFSKPVRSVLKLLFGFKGKAPELRDAP
jgi:pyruvate/2-oxoglutarate dehydrogenase complex dihydrolipoamide dehydrogenase (E3) component